MGKEYNKFRYRGAIHIHSVKSDGTGNIDEITKCAKKAGLSWIIITDHNSFCLEEGIYNEVYVIQGEEISPKSGNHYLAFNINQLISSDDNPQNYIDEVHKQHGFGFAAHPDEKLNRKNNYPALRWDKSYEPDGIEIWNWFSGWGDNLNSKNIFTLAHSFLFKNSIIQQPNQDSLDWWDELNLKFEKIIPAIGGIDAHALKVKKYLIPITVFPYDFMLKTIHNIIEIDEPLAKDFNEAKKQILNAIRNGNNMIVNNLVSGDMPNVFIENAENIACSGESLNFDAQTYLNIEISDKANIRVIWNGQEFYKGFGQKWKLYLSEVGKYRLEFFIHDKAFGYSNPIVVL